MKIFHRCLLVLPLLVTSYAQSQELTPRAYWPAPKGTQVATVGYSYVSGDIVPDPSLPITGVDSEISTLRVGYLQTLELGGRSANIIFDIPYSNGDTTGIGPAERVERSYDGMGDVSVTLSVNFMGAPTMDREAFAAFRHSPRPILGGSVKIVAPTGKYDENRLVNVGANRWALKAELGYIAPLSEKWLLELDFGSWFFQDNNEFVGFHKSQKPVASLQAHLVHRFGPGFWVSLDGSFYKGGRSSIDGRKLDDLQRDAKLGLTLVMPVARRHVVKVGYSLGSVNDTDEDFDVFSVAYSRLF